MILKKYSNDNSKKDDLNIGCNNNINNINYNKENNYIINKTNTNSNINNNYINNNNKINCNNKINYNNNYINNNNNYINNNNNYINNNINKNLNYNMNNNVNNININKVNNINKIDNYNRNNNKDRYHNYINENRIQKLIVPRKTNISISHLKNKKMDYSFKVAENKNPINNSNRLFSGNKRNVNTHSSVHSNVNNSGSNFVNRSINFNFRENKPESKGDLINNNDLNDFIKFRRKNTKDKKICCC